MSTRSRVIPFDGPILGYLRSKTENDLIGVGDRSEYRTDWSTSLPLLRGYQITDTESHPEWRDHVRGRFTGDIGGPFTSKKQWAAAVPDGPIALHGVQGTGANHTNVTTDDYLGPCLPLPPISGQIAFPSFINSSDSKLNQLGTDAIARCSPVNPSADLASAIGETISEGLPRLIGGTLGQWRNLTNRQRRRAIGEEYLNYQFGWVPLVSDIHDFCHSIVRLQPQIEDLERNSGKLVRRRYEFPDSITEDLTLYRDKYSPYYTPSSSALTNPLKWNKGQVYRTEIKAIRRWFSGAFTYYIPPRDGSLRTDMARAVLLAKKTLGISLTPDTVWNLTPWSWIIDWFSNADSVIQNWTNWALYNQVLWYGYMMEHSVHAYRYTFVGETSFKQPTSVPDLLMVSEMKLRRKATPYGFGVSYSTLSTIQKAILAALGVSRSK